MKNHPQIRKTTHVLGWHRRSLKNSLSKQTPMDGQTHYGDIRIRQMDGTMEKVESCQMPLLQPTRRHPAYR
jgi:hypothetical protein